ncbi:hypothetical protein FOZ60_013706 [Perkinsus olseni]|uniref:Ectonucleotide pyrophosphatase phosphodiesterase n=1 Tax=Perkinsus olseni TaxID=32597 RepID=A0A7J6P8A4_PEROL|nr:hypothetical protein FOZ60_013706 [Perkinsus olseni]
MPALLRCALFYLITLIGVDGAIARANEWPNGKFKRAIIIGIDGLGGHYFGNTSDDQAPFLRSMVDSPQACYNFRARAEYPLTSAANWATILTGMTPSDTGILFNEWDPLELDPKYLTQKGVPPVSGRGQLPPTIFKIAKKRNKNIRTALVHSWHWLGRLADENVDHNFHGGNDADHKTARDLIEQIKSQNPPDLSFIQLSWVGLDHYGALDAFNESINESLSSNQVDNAGHSSYWGSDK